MAQILKIFALLSLAILAGGCGESQPTVAEVKGIVSFAGKTAIGGRVLFLPKAGGKQGLGIIQPDGTFDLSTFGTHDGALVGEHQAMIVKAAFENDPDETITFRHAEGQPLVVEPDKVNEFAIELGSREWMKLAD
jgi:hypothetical protein